MFLYLILCHTFFQSKFYASLCLIESCVFISQDEFYRRCSNMGYMNAKTVPEDGMRK